jgi:hypothetical protein
VVTSGRSGSASFQLETSLLVVGVSPENTSGLCENAFAPEFGRTPGGEISIVTRSGMNSFHGTLFDYFRNGVLDATDWFVNFSHLPKPGPVGAE